MTTPEQRNTALRWLRLSHFRFEPDQPVSRGLSERQIQFRNRVLCRIETYSNNIQDMPHSQRNNAQEQLNELLNAGNFFNNGYENMDEALVQLNSTGGRSYRDEGLSEYTGGRDRVFPCNVEASDPFVWFAAALDDKLSDAHARLLDYNSSFAELAARVAVANPDGSTWDDVKSGFEAVIYARTQIQRYHWLLVVPLNQIAGSSRSQEFVTRINSIVDNPTLRRSLGAYSLISTLDTAARMTEQIQQAAGPSLPGSSAETIRRFSQLLGVLRVTCNFLPILGDFYGAMFDGIPELVANFRDDLQRPQRALARAGVRQGDSRPEDRGLFGQYTQVSSQNTANSLCTYCGCEVRTPCSGRVRA